MGGAYRFKAGVLSKAMTLPQGAHKGSYSDGAGNYECLSCGCAWKAERVTRWWPVRFVWSRAWSLGSHGIEVGSDGIERPVVARVFSIGPLRVVLGDAGR